MSLTAVLVLSLSEAPEYEPHTWIGLIPHLAYALPTAITTAVGGIVLWGQRKGRERWKGDRKMLDDIHKQTVNDHPEEENFREQVDRIEAAQKRAAAEQKRTNEQIAEMRARQIDQGQDIGGLREDMGAVRDDVGGLRGELRDDRANLREFRAGVNGLIKRVHPGEDPL